MENWNHTLFLALNASASPDAETVILATVAAEDFVYLACVLAACLWIWGPPGRRGALLSAGLGLLVSFAISWIIGLLWYHPRPFVIGLGQALMKHSPDSSFPSDHTTFLWTLGLGLLVTRAWRIWGWVIIVLGFVTAWARIYVGIHFPFDMAASLVVATASATATWSLYPRVERDLLSPVERFYEAMLEVLHLPIRVFPRRK